MIAGETVVVIRRERIGTLPGNTPEYAEVETLVENVLIDPKPGSDVTDSVRPDGTQAEYVLHFPKGFVGSLRGASVKVRGGDPMEVEGDPQSYTNANTPLLWNRPVSVYRVDG
ncbi:hypothetical protein [Glutamicibacter sp. AOP3-A1-12]|uniref:hypothetical protein n=1 Tax=Glutamicibacter sp. AOP3-A1-12 TaxID=3457701 RepID=UPI00403377D5